MEKENEINLDLFGVILFFNRSQNDVLRQKVKMKKMFEFHKFKFQKYYDGLYRWALVPLVNPLVPNFQELGGVNIVILQKYFCSTCITEAMKFNATAGMKVLLNLDSFHNLNEKWWCSIALPYKLTY